MCIRDRASINYQSPWWDQFALLENHFARLNTALTRGTAVVRVAVVHPIESYWLYWGPSDQTAASRSQMEQQFSHLAETLLFGGIDFDYLCEAELPHLCETGGYPLQVGKMAYETVLIPPVRTLRASTIQLLEAFQRAGGRLIFLGDCPDYVDAEPSDAAQNLYPVSYTHLPPKVRRPHSMARRLWNMSVSAIPPPGAILAARAASGSCLPPSWLLGKSKGWSPLQPNAWRPCPTM